MEQAKTTINHEQLLSKFAKHANQSNIFGENNVDECDLYTKHFESKDQDKQKSMSIDQDQNSVRDDNTLTIRNNPGILGQSQVQKAISYFGAAAGNMGFGGFQFYPSMNKVDSQSNQIGLQQTSGISQGLLCQTNLCESAAN